MKLYIKYMVSQRCKIMVEKELDKLGIKHFAADLGSVDTLEKISDNNLSLLSVRLMESGLELLDDKKSILIEKVINAIIEMTSKSKPFEPAFCVNYSAVTLMRR